MELQLYQKIERILKHVEKPARYMDREWNAIHKKWDEVDVRFALVYPDLYDVGMSHLGTQVLYHILNEIPHSLAERAFSPASDMEEIMRSEEIPLFSLESRRPLSEFDIIGFTLQYEMTYTNILNALSLSNVPMKAVERNDNHPFVIAGGPSAFNSEPVAEFFDFVCLGDGEAVLSDLVQELRKYNKGQFSDRKQFLKHVSHVQGIYVPQLYEPVYDSDGDFDYIKSEAGVPKSVQKAVGDIEEYSFPDKPIVPYLQIVHDRPAIEIFRGCTQGCRFCLAGMVYRPVRERAPDKLIDLCRNTVANTGYSEISLSSLSSTDYSCINKIMKVLTDEFYDEQTSISLPSLRIDEFSVEIANQVKQVRETGITLAPEAGTQRLRNVINKRVTEQDYIKSLRAAFSAGCDTVKLYFMLGLPTETDDDVLAISKMVEKAINLYKQNPGTNRPLRVNLSIACFIPKPHTPFQWEPQLSVKEFERRVGLLRDNLPKKGIKFSWHDPEMSLFEGVMARGDRRLTEVIESAWNKGSRFDGWNEHFDPQVWYEAFSDCGINLQDYISQRDIGENLPWDHLDCGIEKRFLQIERKKAMDAEITEDCRVDDCTDCGVCPSLEITPALASQKTGDKRD